MKTTAKRLLSALTFPMVILAMVLLPALPAAADQGTPPYQVWPQQYNGWSFNSQQANSFIFTANCWVSPTTDGVTPSFFAFGNPVTSVYFPVLIQDANPSNSEIVTPSTISVSQSACGFTASPSNQHISFTVKSGTAGLEEAVYTNSQPSSTSPTAFNVMLDRTYYSLVAALPGSQTVGGIIAALKGATNVQIVDTTTSPWTIYNWNGAHYYANGGSLPPTLALTAGAGTGPTGATITGSGSSGTVSFTAGTSTATGTTFTLTTVAAAAGGFNHSPTCTIAYIGANAAGAATCAVTGTGPYVDTISIATTALTASTFYSFAYTLK